MPDTNKNASHNEAQENEAPAQTPLEAVKAAQAASQQNREVAQQRIDATTEVPGQGPPSSKRHHPQRQMYGSGTDES